MSAEVLRRAAALMRERAQAATEGPWSAADEHELLPGADPAWCVSQMRPGWEQMSPTDGYVGDLAETSLGGRDPRDGPNAEHIASWDPLVALAVADWLEDVAWDWETEGGAYPHLTFNQARHATRVAEAYLGESS